MGYSAITAAPVTPDPSTFTHVIVAGAISLVGFEAMAEEARFYGFGDSVVTDFRGHRAKTFNLLSNLSHFF